MTLPFVFMHHKLSHLTFQKGATGPIFNKERGDTPHRTTAQKIG